MLHIRKLADMRKAAAKEHTRMAGHLVCRNRVLPVGEPLQRGRNEPAADIDYNGPL